MLGLSNELLMSSKDGRSRPTAESQTFGLDTKAARAAEAIRAIPVQQQTVHKRA